MPKGKPLKWRTWVTIDGVPRLVAEGDGQGNVIRHMPDEEWMPIEEKIMKNVGEGMSRYVAQHPEPALIG